MRTITFNKKTYQLKSVWDELTGKEYLQVCGTLTAFDISQDEQKTACKMTLFQTICEIPVHKYDSIDPEQWVDLLETTNWLFQSASFSKNPLPELKLNGTVLHGCKHLMSTSTFAEFMAADDAFLDFHINKNVLSAYELLATLWREKRPDWDTFKQNAKEFNSDQRKPFNQHTEKERALVLSKKVSFQYAYGAVVYYDFIRNTALLKNKRFSILFSSSTVRKKFSKGGWFDALLEESGNKFGSFQETSEMNWLIVLLDLANRMKQAKEKSEKQ